MEKTEQSPRCSSSSSFDTASLLAQTSAFATNSSVSTTTQLSHLGNPSTLISILDRTPLSFPPNSEVQVPLLSSSGKTCLPVCPRPGIDVLSSLSYIDSGPCSWWSATSPVATTAEFPGCSLAPTVPTTCSSDHCGRAELGDNVSVTHGSISQPQAQPRRIVEEVLGHLYAKPPLAEVKSEPQVSGIHNSSTSLSSSSSPQLGPITSSQSLAKPPKVRTNASLSNQESLFKTSEKQKSTLSSPTVVFPASSVSSSETLDATSTKSLPLSKAKSLETKGKSRRDRSSILPTKSKKKMRKNADGLGIPTRNGESINNTSRNALKKGESRKVRSNKHKMKSGRPEVSSESELHSDDSSSASSSSGSNNSTTGPGSVSTSGSSESSDEDDAEREKKQRQLAKLKKQQQELRRKVQELKQASQESSQLKSESQAKRISTTSSKNSVPSSNSNNAASKPSPSPAHSASSLSSTHLPPVTNVKLTASPVEEDMNMSLPLDLCVKKAEPSFQVDTSSTSLSSTLSPSVSSSTGSQLLLPNKIHSGPKKRGRKPKFALPPVNIIVEDNMRNSQQVSGSDSISSQVLLMHPETTSSTGSLIKKSGISSKVTSSLSRGNSELLKPLKLSAQEMLLAEANGISEALSALADEDKILPSTSFSRNASLLHEKITSSRMKNQDDKSDHILHSKGGHSSPSDSDMENDNSDSDDTEQSATGSTASSVPTSSSGKGMKRPLCDDMDESPTKKKRVLPDEKEIRIPLEHGWRRQTKIRCFSRSGVRGEVTYFAPCGKKLRNYPEVVRYLIKHGIMDISRDNFTFSTKINVGEFLERSSSGVEEYILISEQEVVARIEEVRSRKGRLGLQVRRPPQQKTAEEEEKQRQWEEKQLQHQLEQQELAREEQESKMMQKHEKAKDDGETASKEEKKHKAEEARRQKEHERVVKQQERFERLEQLRIEREVRAQQLLEERELKRQQAVFLREQEMQKRREMLLMVDLERERRRQHMLLVRALETRKKQEERERKREEILYEKRINKEKRMEQRRMELHIIREMKKPIEDMTLKDASPLPALNRIPGVKLPGKAFADTLMFFEFLHNFGETLGFDMESLPTLNTMQMALLNLDEKSEEELLSVVHHLLICAIDDPGVPHCPEALTILGQTLKEADINNSNASEILRLYFMAHDKKSEMYRWLSEKPFLALNPSQKAEIIAFLCNELLCSRALVKQMDNSIETVNTLRKDKWIVEGELRKLRVIQQKRFKFAKHHHHTSNVRDHLLNNSLKLNSSDRNVQGSPDVFSFPNESLNKEDSSKVTKEKDEFEDNEDAANESGNESDDTQGTGHVSDAEVCDEEPHLTDEELSKKIEKLAKQQSQYGNKLLKASNTLRATTFGQDRYHRRYWILPCSGGIYIEGMESGELLEQQQKINNLNTHICIPKPESKPEVAIKTEDELASAEKENKVMDDSIEPVVEPKVEVLVPEKKVKEVSEEKLTPQKEKIEVKEKEKTVDKTQEISEKNCTKKLEEKHENIFLAKLEDHKTPGNKDEKVFLSRNAAHLENEKKSESSNLHASGDQNWLLHSPFFASLLAGNMLFNGPMMHNREVNGTYFNLPKNETSNPFGPFLGFPSNFLSPDQIMRGLGSEKQSNQKPWFSILPRMPCDENSLQQTSRRPISKPGSPPPSSVPQSKGSGTSPSASSSAKSPSHSSNPEISSSSHVASALANLQLELMNGLPPSFFLHPFLPHSPYGSSYQNNSPSSSTSLHPSSSSPCCANMSGSEFNLNFGQAATSTPNSSSATIGAASQESISLHRDSPSPVHMKKQILEKLQQLEMPDAVPVEFQRGWWKITDSGQLKTLISSFHHRGIREKMLQKQLQKQFNYACSICSKSQQEVTDLEITDEDREISKLPGGAPDPDPDTKWSRDVALRVDIAILEQVESLEEKVAGASMQVKCWKVSPKLTINEDIIFYPACEEPPKPSNISEPDNNSEDEMEDSSENTDKLASESNSENCVDESESVVNEKCDKTVDRPVKAAEEAKGRNKKSSKDSNAQKEASASEELEDEKPERINPVEVAKERLLLLEAAIERRYLRPPLGTSHELNISNLSSGGNAPNQPSTDSDEIPSGLLQWREAVMEVESTGQLSMCLNLLEACIAWDKSIMRASCQFCHNGDNEEMLLLCDGCDKGYHTYCFKPKMETIPDGDWYCYECLNKATGDKVCVLCGKDGKLLECDACPKTFHIFCLDPPLAKIPKGKWSCKSCSHNKPKKSSKKSTPAKDKDKDKESSKETKESSGSKKADKEGQPSKSKSVEKKEKNKAQISKDLAPCTTLLEELAKHEDAWPFASPVNTKQFPTYRKIIKKPMDFSTVQSKLENGTYKTKEDFANDIRLIFDNCETFNEDDSPVGRAGHGLRAYFETSWAELWT